MDNLLKNSKAFCIMPWIHLHVTTKGNITPCCLVNEPIGNINEQTIKEAWQGEEIRSFRRKMMNDERDSRCQVCYSMEDSGNRSLRLRTNEEYESKIDWVKHTTKEGYSYDSKPIYWDIRFSNICNFRCRTCGHASSSKWFEDAKKIAGSTANQAIIRAAENTKAFLLQLDELLPSVEEIYFAGGEPLLMEEHYLILFKLLELDLTKVKLRYNTNFSELTFKKLDVLELWNKFPNVIVGASLDATSERGEFIRKEQNWDSIVNNRRRMMELAPHADFFISCTVSALNILHITEFHREWVEKNLIELSQINLNILEYPDYYNIKILPLNLKLKVRQMVESHINWMHEYSETKGYDKNKSQYVIEMFDNCLTYLFLEDWSDKIPDFKEESLKMDKLRNELIIEKLPELGELFNEEKTNNLNNQ